VFSQETLNLHAASLAYGFVGEGSAGQPVNGGMVTVKTAPRRLPS
jgi:hypothetical protein